jgi:hypothetical protein
VKVRLSTPILNSALTLAVVGLLTGPLLLGQALMTSQSGALGVMDVRQPGSGAPATPVAVTRYGVTLNTADFQNYVSFSSPIQGDRIYQTSATFTAFAGQQASYTGLMTIVNPTAKPISLHVQTGTISGVVSHSRIWLTLAPDGMTPFTLLTQPGKPGDAHLTVADASALRAHRVVVGTDILSTTQTTLAQTTQTIQTSLALTHALTKTYAVGEKVFLGPAFYLNSVLPILDMTQSVTLESQQKAIVTLVVATDVSTLATSKVVLPVVITEE